LRGHPDQKSIGAAQATCGSADFAAQEGWQLQQWVSAACRLTATTGKQASTANTLPAPPILPVSAGCFLRT